MNKCGLPAAALLLSGLPLSAAAEQVDPVVVTATRTAQTADETLASVTVITREEIERRQAQSVPDVLRGAPGVEIVNNGGPGKATSVSLRGTESDHVLVLVDGVKVGSATLGTAAFQDIPVEQIERVEIVRGPRSSLYGSEAIGGVLQIFTRKGGGAYQPFFSIGGGSYRTSNASAGIAGGGERGWFNASASGLDTQGFDACDPDGPAFCPASESDDDGYRNLSGSLRAGYRFDNGAEMDVHALRAEGSNEFDGSDVNESEALQEVLGANLTFSPAALWQASLAAGRSRDRADNFKDGDFQTRFDTRRDSFSFQNDVSVATDHLLTLGADYQDDRVDSTSGYAVASRDNTGLFAQYQGMLGAHDLQLSLRRDDNEQFGEHDTGGAAWAYALNETLRLTASYGTAFKAPSFNELYFPGYGNPDLRPETSRSLEFGLRGQPDWGRWALTAHETRVDDLIAHDASAFAPANIGEARIRGIEAIVGNRLGRWDLNASLTLLDPENRSDGPNDGNVLPRRARQSLRLDADRALGRYRFGATVFAAGKRYDDLDNSEELSGYATVDLRAERALARDWRLQARIENLLDEDYETAAAYNQPGRSLFVTLRYQPE